MIYEYAYLALRKIMWGVSIIKHRKLPILAYLAFGWTGFASAPEMPVSSIAFGSCLKQSRPQPVWESVLELKPDVFVLLGDNIYGDTQDMKKLHEKWCLLNSVPGFQKLRSQARLLAVWDDHDYGENDAGEEYAKKVESQEVFLNFLDEPYNSVRRKTPGIYDSVTYGPVGSRVQFVLLDTRYFRTSLRRAKKREIGKGPYEADFSPDARILGEKQWKWLEERLNEPAELRIIASSIQVLSNDHGWETWGNFPIERKRLLSLLCSNQSRAVIVISGDRHSAEISRYDGGPFPLMEITSSSMNQRQRPQNEANVFRIGEKYFKENFGMLKIYWNEKGPKVEATIRDVEGKIRLQYETQFKSQ